jgi:hypothetical protein
MDRSVVVWFIPQIAGAALGLWALVLMYIERRDARKRRH